MIEKVKILDLKLSMCVAVLNQTFECFGRDFPKLHQLLCFVRSTMSVNLTYVKVKQLMFVLNLICDSVPHSRDSKHFDIKKYFPFRLMVLSRMAAVKYQHWALLHADLMTLKNSFHKNFGS